MLANMIDISIKAVNTSHLHMNPKVGLMVALTRS
jgi:hypothetical protein